MERKGWTFSWGLEARRRSEFLESGWLARKVGWNRLDGSKTESAPKAGQNDQRGNRGEREIHLGPKGMPFPEKETELNQAKEPGQGLWDGQGCWGSDVGSGPRIRQGLQESFFC